MSLQVICRGSGSVQQQTGPQTDRNKGPQQGVTKMVGAPRLTPC